MRTPNSCVGCSCIYAFWLQLATNAYTRCTHWVPNCSFQAKWIHAWADDNKICIEEVPKLVYAFWICKPVDLQIRPCVMALSFIVTWRLTAELIQWFSYLENCASWWATHNQVHTYSCLAFHPLAAKLLQCFALFPNMIFVHWKVVVTKFYSQIWLTLYYIYFNLTTRKYLPRMIKKCIM